MVILSGNFSQEKRLTFVTEDFTTFFTTRTESCDLELTLGASSPKGSPIIATRVSVAVVVKPSSLANDISMLELPQAGDQKHQRSGTEKVPQRICVTLILPNFQTYG